MRLPLNVAATPSFRTGHAVLPAVEWRAAAAVHRERMLNLVDGTIDVDPMHPIFNFLFQYYSFDHGLLLKWSPGMNVICTGVSTAREPDLWTGKGWQWDSIQKNGGWMAPELCTPSVRKAARAAAEIMRRSQSRTPHLNCYGLHEWAMLYAPDAGSKTHPRRHQQLPLRLSQSSLNAVVEEQPIGCTHFDAFRFFTPEAAPLNTVEGVTRDNQVDNEQPGCVHSTMDLFRYSLKLWPWVPAELLADTLELAVAARVLDMRASPYDLSEYHTAGGSSGGSSNRGGFDLTPVRIESASGRREYQVIQANLARRAAPLRSRLLREYEAILAVWDADK